MSVPFYAKSPENQGYIKNMEVVGFCDLNGVNAFQMALHKTDDGRYYMYYGTADSKVAVASAPQK